MRPGARLACVLLLAAAVGRLWLMPLPSSFWVDEMATVFVVQRGAADPSLRVAPQVPQSVYYQLPRAAETVLGVSEVSFRVPSLVAMALALCLIARLAARLIHPAAQWFAVFGCLALRGIDYQAGDARPYGLGTLVACVALFFLVRWLDAGLWRDALFFAAAAAMLWRVHLIFWPFYLVFLLYTGVRLFGGETPVRWPIAGVVFAIVVLLLCPVLFTAMDLFRQAQAHVVVPVPGLRELLGALKLGLPLICGIGGWAVARLFGWRGDTRMPGFASLVLIASWWLCQPLCLYVFSRITGASVFVSRYLWLGLPGGVLAATVLAGRYVPSKKWNTIAAALGVGVLVANGQWGRIWPLHHNSDWRSAAEAVNLQTRAAGAPVICPSPFIEARTPVWRPDYPLPGFLYAHLYAYPIHGTKYLFPFEPSTEAEAFATSLLQEKLRPAGRFLIYGGAGQAGFWRKWFAGRSELMGWTNASLGDFADVEAIAFESNARAPSH